MSKAELMEAQIRTDPRMVGMYGMPYAQPQTTQGIQREMRENKRKKLVGIYILLIIIGIIGVLFAVLDNAGIKRFQETADKANVTVTYIKHNNLSDKIYVTYEYDSKVYTNVSAGNVSSGKYETADEITVYINRHNPYSLMQDIYGRFDWLRNVSIALIILGSVLLIIRHFRRYLSESSNK